MRRLALGLAALCLGAGVCQAQGGGGFAGGGFGGGFAGYDRSSAAARAEQSERAKRTVTRDEIAPPGSMFVDASVLINTKADAYVVIFGLMQEGATPAECQQKMDATIAAFTAAVEKLGIRRSDQFVDFVSQDKVYTFDIQDTIAKERLSGFQLKKNVAIHFRDYAVLDKLIAAAAESQIFDLIKVDYVLTDQAAVQNRLMEQAVRVLKQKRERYQRLMGIRLAEPPQIIAAKPSMYFPIDMYDSYVAAEGESVTPALDRQRYVVQHARKSRTIFFNGLNASGFDAVVDPIIIEPVVQCTLYVKARYAVQNAAPPPAKASRRTGK